MRRDSVEKTRAFRYDLLLGRVSVCRIINLLATVEVSGPPACICKGGKCALGRALIRRDDSSPTGPHSPAELYGHLAKVFNLRSVIQTENGANKQPTQQPVVSAEAHEITSKSPSAKFQSMFDSRIRHAKYPLSSFIFSFLHAFPSPRNKSQQNAFNYDNTQHQHSNSDNYLQPHDYDCHSV